MYSIILAGGRGSRLAPLTDDRPKPMVEINGAPMLEHQVRQLETAGIKNLVVCESYRGDVIRNHFGDGSHFGVSMQHLDLEFNLNSAGAIKKALDVIPRGEKNVALVFGDIISNIDMAELMRQHARNDALVTAVVKGVTLPYGEWQVKDGRTVGFREKPTLLNNAAVFAINSGIYDFLVEGKDFSKGTMEPLTRGGGNLIQTFEHSGFWKDIADKNYLLEAEGARHEWELPKFSPQSYGVESR